jgi:hypothetical protein
MADRPIKPIRPISPEPAVREVELRRRPSLGQLRRWLAFVKKKARDRRNRETGGG